MEDNRWLGWIGLVVAFMIYQAVRTALRGGKSGNSGMARLNAAAERILKERGVTAANRIPHTTPPKNPSATAKPRNHPAVLKAGAIPAVTRRDGLLGGRKEPVIQRRH